MLISIPTDTSTIFGAFQAIWLSICVDQGEELALRVKDTSSNESAIVFNSRYAGRRLIQSCGRDMLLVIRAYLNASDTTMLVDVVDDHNRVVARADRTALLRDHLNFRTVHILLSDSADRMILQHLNSSHPRHPNRIGSTVAGYLRAGESYRAAARRKLKAELGLRSALTYVSEIEVPDEGSRKFVGIFSGKVTQSPTIADPFIAELVVLDGTSLSQLIADSPQSFTPTFIAVYERFRAQRP